MLRYNSFWMAAVLNKDDQNMLAPFVCAGLCACVLLAACGDNISEVDGARSGSRLKLRWFELDDGLRHWEAEPGMAIRDNRWTNTEVFYDEDLDVMCSAELWADGVTRCTPSFEQSDRRLFSDSSCTVGVSANPAEFKFFGELGSLCGQLQLAHVYPVTRTTTLDKLYFKDTDGSCTPGSVDEQREFGVLGDEVSDMFATLVTSTSHDLERVQVRYRESDDGMRLPIGLQDELLGSAILSQMYAVPDQTGQDWYWTDETCSKSTVVRVEAGCPAPVSAYSWANQLGRYSRVAERVTPSTVYRDGPAGCTATPNENSDYYRIIDESLPLADMVTAPEIEPDRRIQVVSASTGTRSARTGVMLDTQFGDCGFYEFPDGVFRCAPLPDAAGRFTELFSDSACQVPIELAWTGFVMKGYQSSMLLLDHFRPEVEIRDISERYHGPIYELEQGGQCSRFDTSSSDWRRVGRVVEWNELARADLVTD